jgi:putative endonuclease
MKSFYVYILCSSKNGTLYIGVTNDLNRRIQIHKKRLIPGFTQQYGVECLVYYEIFESITAAIRREKQLKKWNRQWKIQLIEKVNPGWIDLFDSSLGPRFREDDVV